MTTQAPKIILALPTKDEEENIYEMVAKARTLGYPFFVIDGHSTDRTLAYCDALGVEVHQRDEYGWGYGCGIRKALDIAAERGYDYLAFIDCDNSYPVDAIREFAKYLPEYDCVVGARPMPSIAFLRRVGNISHSLFASLVFLTRVKDVNSGLRIISVKKFHGYLNSFHNGMVSQITCFALRNKLKMIEAPISYAARKGQSKTKIWDAIDIFYQIILERFRKKVYHTS